MHISTLCKHWTLTISLLALLISSFASGNMPSFTSGNMTSSMMSSHSAQDSLPPNNSPHHNIPQTMKMNTDHMQNCSEDMAMIQTCSPSACSMIHFVLPFSFFSIEDEMALALFSKGAKHIIIERKEPLYRPPIV